MKKILAAFVLMLIAATFATGCKSHHSGSREFIPGEGWKQTD